MARFKLVQRKNPNGSEGMVYVHWTDPTGQLQRKSADTKDKAIARKRADAIMAGHFAAPSPAVKAASAKKVAAETVTMAQAFDRCFQVIWTPQKISAMPTYRSMVKILNTMIGHELVTAMTYSRLEDLVMELTDKGYAASTVDRKMAAVSSALKQATKEVDANGTPWLAGKPAMPVIEYDNFVDRVVSPAEQKAIFAAVAERVRKEPKRDWRRYGCLIRFLIDEGSRMGETLALTQDRVQSVNVNGVERWSATFHRKTTKNKRTKVVWLTEAVVETLPYLNMCAIDGLIFPFNGNPWYMWDTLRKDVKAMGFDIDDVTQHTFRHTALTRMARSGKFRIEEIADWAGHRNIQITIDRYRHMMPHDSAHLVDHMNSYAVG